MAILKHIASKNADYGEAQRYLIFQHDEYTGKPVLDENGRMQLREEYYLDGVECDPFSFDMECKELNARFHKNQKYGEIKSHHYIISFDPKDRDKCGLTGEKAQSLGLEYCKKNFPGHQALVCTVCTHTGGITGAATSLCISSSKACAKVMWNIRTLWSVTVIPVPGTSTIYPAEQSLRRESEAHQPAGYGRNAFLHTGAWL